MVACVAVTTTLDSSACSVYFFAMAGFLFPAFPPKAPRLDRLFTYLGVERRLQQEANKASASRADAALLFLRSVPEVKEKKWTMAQFDTVWHQLVLYVKDGSFDVIFFEILTPFANGTKTRKRPAMEISQDKRGPLVEIGSLTT